MMAGPNTVNFFQPGTDAAVDQSQIQRQRLLAQMLAQRSTESPQGQMVGRHFVAPGALSYVNQIAQALGGKYIGDKADTQEREMGQRLQAQRAAEAQAITGALTGTPGMSREVDGPAAPGQGAPMQEMPGTPADPSRAMALALQSQNPQFQTLGNDLLKRQLDAAELQQALRSAGINAPGGAGGAPAGAAQMGGGAGPEAGGAPAAQPSGGGLPPGISPQAFALTMARNPQAQALGKMIQETSKPINVTEGGTIFDPVTGTVRFTAPKTLPGINIQNGQGAPVPGFQEAQARGAGLTAAAEAQARDQFAAPITVTSAGGPRLMLPAQARAEAQGGPPPLGVGVGATNPAERGMARAGVLDDDAAAAAKREIAAMQRDLQTKQLDEPSKQMLRGEIENLQGQLAAYQPQSTPAAGAGRGAQGGAGIPLESEASSAYNKERAKGFADQAAKVQGSGMAAASSLRDLDQLETLYRDPNVAKGAIAENISGLKNLGASFGVDMKGLSSEQAAQAITNKMALASRSTADGGGMPGAMSDADRNFLKNLQPDLSKSPEGRAKIIDAMRKTAQRQIDVARMANEYEQKNGRLDAGFDKVVRDYAAKNQMFTEAKKGGGFRVIGVQ
jgi:hypothetical protein